MVMTIGAPRPPYDPATDTCDGWYEYALAAIDLEIAEVEANSGALFPVPRVEWRADREFLDDFFHKMQRMERPDSRIYKHMNRLIVRRMLDCMRRDHASFAGEIMWPSIKEYMECTCAASPYVGHYAVEHERELCTGGWTWDPPCGGCINCLLAQELYYKSLDVRENYGPLTWLYYSWSQKLRAKNNRRW